MIRIRQAAVGTLIAVLLPAAASARAGDGIAKPATRPSSVLDAATADNVELRMEIKDLREQNYKLRLQLELAQEDAAKSMIHQFAQASPYRVDPGNAMPSTSGEVPPAWQTRRFGDVTYYLIPLGSGVPTTPGLQSK